VLSVIAITDFQNRLPLLVKTLCTCNCLSNTDLAGKFMLQTDKELMQLGFIALRG
jgi:hypothetical protein